MVLLERPLMGVDDTRQLTGRLSLRAYGGLMATAEEAGASLAALLEQLGLACAADIDAGRDPVNDPAWDWVEVLTEARRTSSARRSRKPR